MSSDSPSDAFDRDLSRLVELAKSTRARLDELHEKLAQVSAVMEQVASSIDAGATGGNGTIDARAAQVEVTPK